MGQKIPAKPMLSTATMELRHSDLLEVFKTKYGEPYSARCGRKPQRRYDFGYFSPDDYYEATIEKLIQPGTKWLDVGGGRDVFPMNPELARTLADRSSLFVGVDPSGNIHENPFVHEKHQVLIQDYHTDHQFDVITLRMVAEHIDNPQAAIEKMASLLAPNGKIVIYTINKWTPIALAAWVIPFKLHHPIKRLFWSTEQKDTFPVEYRMNTRTALARYMTKAGLSEESFSYLDDCRTLFRFEKLHFAELRIWKMFKSMGWTYPENCLLGIYTKPS